VVIRQADIVPNKPFPSACRAVNNNPMAAEVFGFEGFDTANDSAISSGKQSYWSMEGGGVKWYRIRRFRADCEKKPDDWAWQASSEVWF